MNLETLAQAVKSNFDTLQESEILGRIMIVSGRDFDRSLKGFSMLKAQNLIPENFIELKTRGIFLEMIEKRPGLKLIMQRLDLVPGKITLNGKPKIEFLPPPKLSDAEILERLKFADLDF